MTQIILQNSIDNIQMNVTNTSVILLDTNILIEIYRDNVNIASILSSERVRR